MTPRPDLPPTIPYVDRSDCVGTGPAVRLARFRYDYRMGRTDTVRANGWTRSRAACGIITPEEADAQIAKNNAGEWRAYDALMALQAELGVV